MKNKVYIITSGEYSDYTIERCFSTAKQAREFCDRFDDRYRVEVFIIDDVLPPKEESVFTVEMFIGTKKIRDVSTGCELQDGELNVSQGGKVIRFGIKTDSRKRAIKVASERYDQVFALESTKYPYLRVDIVRFYSDRVPPIYDFASGDIILDRRELACELPPSVRIRGTDDPGARRRREKVQKDIPELTEALRKANEQILQAAAGKE